MTDPERLAQARDIIHSDMASAFGDVLAKREEGYMVPKGTLDMALALERLYKLLHPHPGCPHPEWDEELDAPHGLCPCGDVLTDYDDGHGNKRPCCYRCQEPPEGCKCTFPRWDYDMERLKELSKEIRASEREPCPGPHCSKTPVGKCLPCLDKANDERFLKG